MQKHRYTLGFVALCMLLITAILMLAGPSFASEPLQEQERPVRVVIKIVEPFEVLEGVSITRDKDDDIFFRVAKACGAKIIVSGDKDVLDKKRFEEIRAVTARRLIESLDKLGLGKSY